MGCEVKYLSFGSGWCGACLLSYWAGSTEQPIFIGVCFGVCLASDLFDWGRGRNAK